MRAVTVSSFAVVLSLGLSLGLGGCGGCNDSNGVGHLPDAPAAPDAMSPDAVSLSVINQGVPVVGVPVYFLDADGSLASATVTDANGNASAVVTAGGSVTAIRPFTTLPAPAATADGPDELRTFLGVKPGDHLVLSRAVTDTVNVTFDGAAPDGGNSDTGYQLVTTCGDGVDTLTPGGSSNGSGSPDPGATLQLANCHGAADVAVVASGGGLDGALSLYHASAPVAPGGNATVNLRGDTYTDASDVTFSYTNAPDAPITVQHWPILPKGYLGPYSATVEPGATDVTITEATVPAAMELVDSSLRVDTSVHHVVDWGPYAKTYAADLGPSNALLRQGISGPTFDIATKKLTWVEAAAGVAPDLSVAAIQVTRGEATWRWEIAAPYAASEIAFPQLPADAATWVPTTGDTVTTAPVANVKVSGGYNAVRAHIFDAFDASDASDGLDPTAFVIGTGGHAAIMQFPVRPPPPPGVR